MSIQKRWLVPAAALLLSGTAWADAWYIRGDFAYSWAWDQSAHINAFDGVSLYDLKASPVPMGQLGFGYVLAPYLRFDITGSLTGGREITLDCAKTPSSCSSTKSGYTTIDTESLFANVYYEMASIWTQGPSRWHPYIGFGLGSAHQSMNNVHTTINGGSGAFPVELAGDGQWQFAWRAMTGLAVTLTENLLLDMSYIYMDGGQAESGTAATFPPPPGSADLTRVSMEMKVQEVYIGLRQEF